MLCYRTALPLAATLCVSSCAVVMCFQLRMNHVSAACASTPGFFVVVGASAEQHAAELQKQVEEQTARILSMEEQRSTTQAAAVAAAHGMHQPFVCCSPSWCVVGPIAEPLLLQSYVFVATVIVMGFADVISLKALSVLTPTTSPLSE